MATVSDNFNRSDGDLDGSTASGGGLWVEFENANWDVFSNRARCTRTTNHIDHSARLDVALDGDDHEVEATLAVDNSPGGSYFNVGIIARKEDNSTKTFYGFVAALVQDEYRLFKFVAGSYTLLDTGVAVPTVTDVMRLKCDGSAQTGYIDDVEDVSGTDSAIDGAGYIQVGLILDNGTQVGDASLDDFSGTDLAGGNFQSVGGVLTPVGTLIKSGRKPLAGSLTPVGIISKVTSKTFAGVTTPVGVLVKQAQKAFTGSTTASGSIVKQTGKKTIGSITGTGILSRAITKIFTGSTTTVGVLEKQTAKSFTGSVTASGILSTTKVTLLAIGGVITASGTLIKQTAKIFTGSVTTVGTLIKRTVKSFIGSITAVGSLATQKITGGFTQVVGGALTMSGIVVRQTGKQTAGIVTMAGSITKRISKSITGTLTAVGTLIRQIVGLPVPATRIYAIESENRVYAIEAESRVYAIESENRIYPIPG